MWSSVLLWLSRKNDPLCAPTHRHPVFSGRGRLGGTLLQNKVVCLSVLAESALARLFVCPCPVALPTQTAAPSSGETRAPLLAPTCDQTRPSFPLSVHLPGRSGLRLLVPAGHLGCSAVWAAPLSACPVPPACLCSGLSCRTRLLVETGLWSPFLRRVGQGVTPLDQSVFSLPASAWGAIGAFDRVGGGHVKNP